jgi:predicted dehydrogenase
MSQHTTPGGYPTRRDFIKKSAAAATAAAVVSTLKTPVYGQSQAPSAGRVIGANDRIVCAFVGVGGQGYNAHVRTCKDQASRNNTALAAVCDVSKHRVGEVKNFVGEGCEGYGDYRRIVDRKDIDVIFCSTVDHWHTPVTLAGLQSGKHVYVEKPMTRYLGEAFEIYDMAKRTGKLVNVGSQGSSDQKWHQAAKWIKAGKIGPVVMCQGSYMRNNPKGEWNYGIAGWATPEDIDWKQWLGQVHKQVPFNADHYFRWRKYFPYCSGLLGDLIPHKLHPYMLATGNPEFPTRVASLGNRSFKTDRNTPGTPERDVDEIVQVIAEFPSGMVMHVTSSTVNETGTQELIRGHRANLQMGGNRVELRPERPFTEEVDPEVSEQFPAESVAAHHVDFFDAIRTGRQPNAGIDLAVRVQTVISLAEMSSRLNAMCLFDEKTRKVTTQDGREVKPINYGWNELS